MKIIHHIFGLMICLISIGGYTPVISQVEPALYGEIAFVGGVYPDTNISIIDLDTNIIRTVYPYPAFDPVWSPNGEWIAFARQQDGNSEIFALNIIDGRLLNVSNLPTDDNVPRWSPDSSQIAFISRGLDLRSRIYIATVASGELFSIIPIETEASFYSPTWSPDGHYLAYLKRPPEDWAEIYIMDLETQETRFLASDDYSSLVWSPNGEWIAADAPDYLSIIDTTGNIRGLKDVERAGAFHPEWSPDGDRITFSPNALDDVFVIDSSGANERNLTKHLGGGGNPNWSPDGEWIVFTSNRDHMNENGIAFENYVIHLETGITYRLTNEFGMYPAWRPRP